MKHTLQKHIAAICLLPLLVSTGCANEQQIAEQPAPLYEIAPDIIINNIQADVPADELAQVEQICQMIADECADLYQTAKKEPSPYMTNQMVLPQTSIDAIEIRLIEQGYTVLDTDSTYPSFLQNADGFYQLWEAAQNGRSDKQYYIWVSPYGGFHYCQLEQRSDGAYFLEAAVQLNGADNIEITELYKRSMLDWELTKNGNVYYKLYEAHSPAFEDYTLLRLKEPEKALCELSAAYVEPVGYQSNNLFSCNWDSSDYTALCFNDLLEFLYHRQTGEILRPLSLQYQA